MGSLSKKGEDYEDGEDGDGDQMVNKAGKKFGLRGDVRPEEVERARLKCDFFRNPNRFVDARKRSRNARVRKVRAEFNARAKNTVKR